MNGVDEQARPGSGKTLRVWQIADEITAEKARRAERGEVRRRFLAEGGNANTANTQYQAWKKNYDGTPRTTTRDPAAPNQVDPRPLRVASDGRLPIPRDMRAAMRLPAGGRVVASVVAGELRLVPQAVSIRRVQARLKGYRKPGESIVDRFLAERRELWGET